VNRNEAGNHDAEYDQAVQHKVLLPGCEAGASRIVALSAEIATKGVYVNNVSSVKRQRAAN
jgi:hypothetical protein